MKPLKFSKDLFSKKDDVGATSNMFSLDEQNTNRFNLKKYINLEKPIFIGISITAVLSTTYFVTKSVITRIEPLIAINDKSNSLNFYISSSSFADIKNSIHHLLQENFNLMVKSITSIDWADSFSYLKETGVFIYIPFAYLFATLCEATLKIYVKKH